MRYKIKWRSDGQGPLKPEILDTVEATKARVRELLAQFGDGATIDVWNEDETWQIVSHSGVADWSKKD